ncbi:16S rRNA (pseudouridine(914)-N(1))-methyltransferase Nep1 [Picrophilus oshimae]|uniref:Ribosomal RNA small subunit methyltransferase Nep1 n=1 Tax=Picrophilus torridus (strain ATCC 700027 / DSM 9790 / JCM 10055 / NBRC 100828 / KAW 2/3) TaxID=1122961 RepID=Q6L170_PICTO|nr:16S rRNA (pseudouridine(914)-N(1))-methyltransferase Nep1 [Picrophilus oshimae]AAT43282.1 multicopy suppressor of ras1 [Picrophilus oshimae DSM 9789]SMD30411.1 rRNA small subunit pseudouridine methyltransferase Nep1 [Picrophilus oshimae DSM 9789]
MLNIVIGDAELETIPDEMRNDPVLRRMANKNKKDINYMLLDSNYMHSIIERYYPGKSNRFGRPDIIYIFLEVALESILNKSGNLRIFIHTKRNKVIEINPEVRLPKSYNRFQGLIEDLFRKNRIVYNGNTLLDMYDMDLLSLLSRFNNVIVLSPHGEKNRLNNIISDDVCFLIGGFSEGDYITDVYKKYKSYSIFNEELTIWSVGMEVITEYERFKGLL